MPEREFALLLRLEVVEGYLVEVAENDVAGNFIVPARGSQFLNVLKSLGFGLNERLTRALVFSQQAAFPKEVNPVVGIFQAANRFLK